MPIEMPRGLPFSVDTWTPASARKRYHFLTHAHRDHLAGIATQASYPIYSTLITKTLVCSHVPQLEDSLFVEIEVGETVVLNDPDGEFSVTAFDANHCPGAVMFLFEGGFGNILHTGDCRLAPEYLHNLPIKYFTNKGRENALLDYLFLDCTFGRCSLKLPSKQTAIRQVINCIWKHPNAPVVYLACDMLGQEEILIEVSRTFGTRIHIDREKNSECFLALSLIAPEIITQDASSRFHVIEGFPRLNERAAEKLSEARANLQPGPLFIRPSAQWYAANDRLEMTKMQKSMLAEAERDEVGVWHICYSMHSSRDELDWALQLLQPKWVISTTPPCRAMELDYVKKHCFKTRITSDDPLWKLLKVRPGKSATLPVSSTSEVPKTSTASTAEVEVSTSKCSKVELKNLSADHLELKLDLSRPSRARPIMLFGRTRLGIEDSDMPQLEKQVASIATKDEVKEVSSLPSVTKMEQAVSCRGENTSVIVRKPPLQEVVVSNQLPSSSKENKHKVNLEKSKESPATKDTFSIGSSKTYNASLRKLYRSMNIPVPQPLPSLVELMSASKRAKSGAGSNFNGVAHSYNALENSFSESSSSKLVDQK